MNPNEYVQDNNQDLNWKDSNILEQKIMTKNNGCNMKINDYFK